MATIRMTGIRKAFAGVEVLHGIDFSLEAGQTHALVGENGAGKSTLIKVLGGVYPDYSGEIAFDSALVRMDSPRVSESAGVAIIFQELSLVGPMSVAENIFLGREPANRLGVVDHGSMARQAESLLQELGIPLNVSAPVESLSIAEQQMVEIAKALSRRARFLIMDEPTSTLPERDVERLFALMERLRDSGAGLLYVSHKMDEIYRVADRITVLRDGDLVGTARAEELPADKMIKWMVGREIDQFLPRHAAHRGKELLRVEELSLYDPVAGRRVVDAASFTVHAGEIVGLAGLRGAGNSELLCSIYGRYGKRCRARFALEGKRVDIPSPGRALDLGIILLTNDRKASGIVPPMSVLQNLTLASLKRLARTGVLTRRREWAEAEGIYEKLSVKASSPDLPVEHLSGGNQQKVLLGRWLMRRPRILLLDEPTRGIDVGAKAEVYRLMNSLADEGYGIVFTSTELPELIALSDRIIVMHRGRITREFPREEATQESVTAAAMQEAV